MNDLLNIVSTFSIIPHGSARCTSLASGDVMTPANGAFQKRPSAAWLLMVAILAASPQAVRANAKEQRCGSKPSEVTCQFCAYEQGCVQEAAATAADAQPAPVPEAKTQEQPAQDLLDGEFAANWKLFSSDPQTDAATVWKIMPELPEDEKILICTGMPKGFAFTAAEYSDFELSLEWRYPEDPSGNSGILIYTQNEPRIWPTAIQIQLHQPKAGSIFPSGDAVSDNTLDSAPDLARPVKTWNACRILSRAGRITVEINGKRAGEVTGAKPATGRIALQSEGSVVHFRRIRLKNLTELAGAGSLEVKAPKAGGSPSNPASGPQL